jgi:bacterial leucyl aminopeptidase
MRASLLSSLLLPAAASARFIEANEVNRVMPYIDALLEEVSASSTEKFLVELSPGETRYITEDEKWELRRVRLPPFTITSSPSSCRVVTCRTRVSDLP